jgi:hypothetical protein
MTNCDTLIGQLDLLNDKGQQIQHQAEMLTRRLPAARTALETIANGDSRSEVTQIAREALIALNTLDAPEAIALFAGALEAQIPPVTVVELKRFRELIGSLAEELGLPADGHQAKGSIATHGMQNLVEKACGPGSNARVLSRRNGLLEMLLWEGYLAPLQSCVDVPEAVLQLFATIPFTHRNHNPEAFLERLRLEGYGSQNKPSLASLDEETRYCRLLHHYRGMSVGNQQLQYEHSVAERKMAIARTALETIANGEADPAVRMLARETLNEFNVLCDAEKFLGFFLSVQQGDAIAPVDLIDLQNFHEKWESVSAGLGKGGAIGLGALALGSAAAEAGPLWFRNSLLGIVLTQGLLADGQQGTELDGSVYRVAATIPLNGVQFDPEAFVTRLRAERSA